VRRWVTAGAREVLLLGQTVDSYRDASLPAPESADPDESQFPALLRLLAREVPELARLRYTSPHPRHATASLARAHAELDVLARHVHLPVQSGSDRVLKRMIRRYTKAEYVARARRLLAARPDMTMSSDFIVGFPGETEADFEATLDLVREVGFVSGYAFKFSPRPHTPALKLKDDVPEEAKSERLTRLLDLLATQQRAHLTRLVGTTQRILVEGRSKSGASFEGRTERNEIVHVNAPPGAQLTGTIVEATITRANKHSLSADLVPSAGDLSCAGPSAGDPSCAGPSAGNPPQPHPVRRVLPLVV
jgi:tRNA-2-methylthio-N6-dimethylallyladenosine synthase